MATSCNVTVEDTKLCGVKRVVLTGFMGSGKSTIGKLLAQRLEWSFIDLDLAIEERCGRTVPQIFAEFGENRFRVEESAALLTAIKGTNAVIALGGGAPETSANRDLLRAASETMIIHLDAPFETLQKRCLRQAEKPGATSRPLFSNLEGARARYMARRPLYEALSTIRLNAATQSPPELVEIVWQLLA